MENWIIYAILGLVAVSFLMALQKVPTSKNIDKYYFNTLASFFTTLFSFIFLYDFISIDKIAIIYAAVWGTSFTVLNLLQMYALEKNDTNGVFPFTSLLSNVFIVIGGILFLNEKVSLLQFLAVILAVLVVGASTYKSKVNFVASVLPLFLSIALISTFNKFIQKFGAVHVEIYSFIFWQAFFSLVSALIILFFKNKQDTLKNIKLNHLLWGMSCGVLGMAANLFIVKSLSTGPISLVYIIVGTYTFFTSLIASIFFKEVLTTKKVLFIIISVLIIILIKIG